MELLKEEFEKMLEEANKGNLEAQTNLGDYYYNGEGLVKNYKEAVKWYTLAANENYAPALKKLGNCYYNGDGVTQNYEEALKKWMKAAEQNYVPLTI